MLDEPDIAKDLLYQNLKELDIINKYLGGHAVSLKGIKKTINGNKGSFTVADIGCGGGDSLKAIASWAKKNGANVQLIGIDLKDDCIEYAKAACKDLPNITFRCNDFRNSFAEQNKPGIVHASLFFHHFTEDDIVAFLKACSSNKAITVINDLERHPIAYYSIKYLTRIFSKSPLVKNDAPLSVLRGFKKREWVKMVEQAGITNYSVTNCWAFRHLIIAYPNGH